MAGQDESYFFMGQLKKNSMWLLGTDGILFEKNMKNIDRSFRLFPKLERITIEEKLEAIAEKAVQLGSKDNMAAVAVIIK